MVGANMWVVLQVMPSPNPKRQPLTLETRMALLAWLAFSTGRMGICVCGHSNLLTYQ